MDGQSSASPEANFPKKNQHLTRPKRQGRPCEVWRCYPISKEDYQGPRNYSHVYDPLDAYSGYQINDCNYHDLAH